MFSCSRKDAISSKALHSVTPKMLVHTTWTQIYMGEEAVSDNVRYQWALYISGTYVFMWADRCPTVYLSDWCFTLFLYIFQLHTTAISIMVGRNSRGCQQELDKDPLRPHWWKNSESWAKRHSHGCPRCQTVVRTLLTCSRKSKERTCVKLLNGF